MKKNYALPIILSFLYLSIFTGTARGQEWKFAKEKDGIRIYTREDDESPVKAFKGEVTFRAPLEKVYTLITNVKNFDWWDDDINGIKVLSCEPDKRIQYYLIYDSPWPVTDRDLVVDTRISINSVTGERDVEARALLNVVPEKPEYVRIKNYWQKWSIIPAGPGNVRLVLEGRVDPGGSVPVWLYNMVITETPLKVIRSVQTHVAKM